MQKLLSHTKDKNEVLNNKKEIEIKIAEQEFSNFIQENIKNNISWEEFERKFSSHKIFCNENLNKNKQMDIFKDFNYSLNETKKNLLRDLFQEKIGLNQDITWHDVQHILQNDQRFRNVIERDREALFNEFKLYVQEKVLSEFHCAIAETNLITKDSPTEGNGYNQLVSKLNIDLRFQRLQRNPDKRDKFLRAKIKSLKYEFEKNQRNARKQMRFEGDKDRQGQDWNSNNKEYNSNGKDKDFEYERSKDDKYREERKSRHHEKDYNDKDKDDRYRRRK